MKIMTQKEKPEPTAYVNVQPLNVDGVSGKLQGVTEDGLPVILMEAADSALSVVVAMVRPGTVDVGETLKPISDLLESDALPQGPVFTWMLASEDSPLTQNEKCKDCPVVYVVFARPDVQRRPVACLSIDELKSALAELSG
jgi:hypothetical protein